MEVIPATIIYAGIILVALYALYILVRSLPYVVYHAFDAISTGVRDLSDSIADAFDGAKEEAEKRKRRKEIIEEIKYRVHSKNSSKPDPRLIQLQQESVWIREGLKAYQEHVSMCVEIRHLYKEAFPDVEHMSAFENEPEIRYTQQRSIDFADVLLDGLSSSKMTARSPELLSMRLGLTVMRKVCQDCELLQCASKNVPRMCSVAKWVGFKPASGPIENEHGGQHK